MDLKSLLDSRQPFSLAFHKDADGVFSAAMLRAVYKTTELNCPFIFGDYKEDVAVDLGQPLDPSYSGICIDHHPHTLPNPKYILIHDSVPTGLIIYRSLCQYLKEKSWYVVGSLVGDAQPELIPPEIWEQYPELLDDYGYMYKYSNEWRFSRFPLFNFISSSVNALCRLGRPIDALYLVEKCSSPTELVNSEEVLDAREQLRAEEESILRQKPKVFVFKERYVVTVIQSSRKEISIAGLIASRLQPEYSNKYTLVVINESNGEVSIRGLLATLLGKKLVEKGWRVGGHAGAYGGNIDTSRIREFIEDIRRS